jgi:hypothetical protein
MSLAAGAALLWLIPLGGAIVLLYLLKMRRRDVRVPATFLWPALTYEVRANSLFQRLRLSWLLFLQLLALCLLLCGLARPQVRTPGLAGEVTVIVIDASASMGATDVSPSRFDVAKSAAQNILSTMRPGDRACLIEAGPVPRVACPLSGDVASLRRGLSDMELYDCECDVGEALRLAVSLTAKLPSSRVALLSDGVFPEVRDFAAGNAHIVFERIGESAENVAISALGTTETADGRLLYCELRNYGKLPSLGTLRFKADGVLFNSMKVEVPQRGTLGKTLAVPKGAKVVEAFLDCEDCLKSDNYAVVATDEFAVRTLLVGSGDLFLERALALDPRVVLDKATELPAKSDYDLVVFDGTPEKPTKAKGVLTFGSAGKPSPVVAEGVVSAPRFLDAEEDSPLLQAVDLSGTYVGSAEKVKAKVDGKVLVEGTQGPWVVASDGPPRKVYVAFEPMKSDFPLEPAFPIFISNAIDYLVPRETASPALVVPAGRTFTVPARSDDQRLTITGPDGKRTTLKPFGGSFVVREAKRVGHYRVETEGRSQDVYATFASESASNVAPVDRVILGASDVRAVRGAFSLGDFWRPILLAALLVLAAEWWLFARRS